MILDKEIILRPVRPADHTFVCQLTRQVMQPYVEETWQDEKDREYYYQKNEICNHQTKIIEHQGLRVGRCSIIEQSDCLYLANLHLTPEYQGQGIGSWIIKNLIERAIACQLPITLMVLEKNPAQHLYLRSGFRVIRKANHRYHMIYDYHLNQRAF